MLIKVKEQYLPIPIPSLRTKYFIHIFSFSCDIYRYVRLFLKMNLISMHLFLKCELWDARW